MRQINESYESARLAQLVDEEPFRPFLEAVRSYGQSSDSNTSLRLLELIIFTSRRVQDDDRRVPQDVYEILLSLRDRYQFFAPPEGCLDPVSYRQARRMIMELFF